MANETSGMVALESGCESQGYGSRNLNQEEELSLTLLVQNPNADVLESLAPGLVSKTTSVMFVVSCGELPCPDF